MILLLNFNFFEFLGWKGELENFPPSHFFKNLWIFSFFVFSLNFLFRMGTLFLCAFSDVSWLVCTTFGPHHSWSRTSLGPFLIKLFYAETFAIHL